MYFLAIYLVLAIIGQGKTAPVVEDFLLFFFLFEIVANCLPFPSSMSAAVRKICIICFFDVNK